MSKWVPKPGEWVWAAVESKRVGAAPPDDAYARGYRDGQVAMREDAIARTYSEQEIHEGWVNSMLGELANAIRALPIKEPGA
jgi:hypothetical protein